MTQAEQASLEAVAKRMDDGFREMRADMQAMRELIESRRKDDAVAHKDLEDRVGAIEQDKSIAEAFFSFGRWIGGGVVVVLTLVFAYLSLHTGS